MSCTLAEVEQAVARRCGPFEIHLCTDAHSLTNVTATALVSSIDLGDWADVWLLRRGVLLSGQPVPGFSVYDRQRRVAGFTPATGALVVDRPYALGVQAEEVIELGVLDPAQQLRPAVLAGLARTYFVDRVAVAPTGVGLEHDLSAALFWVVDVGQVRGIEYRSGLAGTVRPGSLGWHRVFATAAGVQVALAGRMGGELIVEALRPHATWVSGADSATGPTLDTDTLDVDLAYAAAAGTIEAWRICRPTLASAATAGLIDGRETAKAEFEAEVNRHVPVRPDRLSFRYPLGLGGSGSGLWETAGPRTWRQHAASSWSGMSHLTWRQVLGT